MEERKESYSLIKNGENAKLPTLSILPDIGRYRRKCSETLLMSYSLQQKGEFSVNIALAEIYSHAKGRVSSSCLPVSQERKQYLPQIVFRQTLNRSAQMNWPPFMTAAWKKIIWDRIPRNLVIKFSSVNAEIEKEVDFLYEKTLQSHGTSERIKLSSAEEQHYITEKEYRKGFSENYSQFLITRTFIEQRLLLRHNLMVKVLEMSVTHVQQLLNDYTKYRSKGPLSLMGWRTNMSNDLRKGENLLQQGMYNKIAKLFLKQGCLDDLPKEYWPQFMKCATYIMVNQILELKKRTLGNVVNMTGDMHKVPYLKIDLVYEEEEGILLIPSQKAIISAFLEIVDDIVRVAEKLDPLESWVSVPVPPGFINVKLLEEHTMEAKRIIQENILKLYSPIENYRHELVDKFSPLYDVALRLELEVFISSENKKFKESCDKIKNLKTFYYKIMELPSNKMFNVVKVNQIDVIKNMMSIYSNYSSRILNELLARHQEQNRRICGRFEQLGCRALTPPKSTEELMEMGKYMVWATSTFMDHIKEEIQRVIKEFSRMIDMTTVTEEHTNLNTETVLWLNNIKPVFQQNALLYEQYKIKFEDDLTKTTDLLVKEIEDLFPRLSVLDMMDDADKVHEYITMIRWFCRKIEHFDETIAWINKEECLFQFPYSTYPELDELKAIIHPFGELIFLIHKWHRTHKLWMDGDFEFIVAKEVEERTEEFHQGLVKTQKMYRERLRQQTTENYPRRFKGNVEDPEFVNLPAPIKLCMKAIDNIRDFQQNIGLVKIMCNPALTQRHWDEMSEIAGLDLTPDAGTTLRKIINMKLEKYLDKFEIISISAMKEKQLKENLMKMLHEWTEIKFTVIMWKETDILILSQFDEIEAIMDDHLVKTLSMRGSAFVKPFEGEVRKWYVTLLRMIQTTDEWGKVQHQWLYLLPFFSSPVITSEIPEEGLLFNEVDSNYKKLMASVKKDPRVTETAGVLGTYETLHTCTENLERINKGLNAYLENKRLYFPRFYFLSNFEMLEILSKMKDPLKVQPHLNKCFDGISKLDFDEHLCIKAMFSEQGEKIDFVSPIYTKAARGSVEKWLIQVENQMTASVRDKIVKSYNEYPESEYTHWILKWPGQVVLCVSLIYWTLQVHQLLRPNTLDSLKSYCNELQTKLNQVVALVSGKLTVQARITLGSYIVLHAHAKEIVEELINKNASSAKDFQWIAHLRYFWEQDVKVCIVNATVNYAYEYLGNTTRLVVTPLTDRCYRTIIGAHYLHLNGAPEGPAGTGKTETVKDLAKALGIRCVVFNCSDGLNYITVGKFFKGLASSGCWACFDEFNRIEVEVLSVIAQQILSVTDAVRAGLNNFTLEGSELKLNPTSFICITMNPECAECSELPDNLKVLFRTVAMTVPDVTLISEISLYSYGYVNARNLAVKIVTTCHLCSAQLSPHNHYDYGLRAVKFVLVTAGNLKQISPDVEEESLIMRALIDSNISKLVTQDIAVFEAIISDLFPIAFMSASNHNNLLNAAREVCKTRFLQPTEVFLLKLIQTYEVMTVYHGFMLIGDSFGGKSTTLKVLADSLSLMCKGDECGNAVIYEIINPRCLTIDQLYGHFDPILHEWTDGIISQIFREFSADESDARKWIIFDGPVDSSWIENMNTVLDDNKKLCLTSGEVIHQTKHMSMIFEVMDLAQASPAIVSRCGMIHMESSALGWKPLVLSWIVKGNPAWRDGNEKLLEDMFDWLAPPCLEFIQKHCVQLVSPGISNLIKSATLLIQMLLEEAVEQNEDTKPLRSWIQAAYFFAGVWSFGGILDGDSQIKFDEFYKSIWKGYNQDYPIPESIEKVEISIPLEGILYDYVYNFKLKGNWKNWPEILKGIKIEDSVNIQSPIPTSESLRYRFLMDMHIRNNLPVLLVGPSGAGKTFYIHNMLTYKLCDEKYMPAFIPFTSQTTGNGTQELFISKLNKRGKNCYGPSNGKKCVIFIDDMDIPAKQISGETSAIELLRQFFDHGHWYDLKTKSKIFVLDILILAAVGLPQNCWQEIKRCLHHFSIYSVNPVSAESICRIYTNILLLSLKRNGFAADVVSSVTSIINATLDVYEGAICHLLPTPTKCHYTFNLRDFSRVIQGCVLLKKESLDSKKLFIKLWVHEVLRVFYDRLVEPEDRTWLYNKLQHSVEEHFNEQFDGCLDTLPMENGKVTEDSLRHLLFGNFMNPSASVEDRKYEEITSLDALTRIAEIALTEYNSMHNPKMDIVLFRYALEHLCHICRIIALPSGSGLLIGVGGSGRQSLTRLAAAIQGTAFYQPDITKNYGVNEWRDNLKKILREAGGFARETTFLLSDSQIKEEEFLQDIDSLLNCGEIPNLYNVDEEQEILEIVRLTAQGGNRNLDISPLSVFSFFISRCKQKMHLILCFSPIGSALRKRMMMYPSLVKSCMIDWFTTWPEDALEMVAQRYMVDINLPFEIKAAAVSACKYFHVSARKVSEEYLAQEGRKSYITSASYLELIHSFTELTNEKQNEIMQAKLRYIGGLDKLDFAAEQVAAMQEELSELKPQLVLAAEGTRRMMKEIEKETIKVEAASNQVREDEKVANVQAAKAQELKIECEADLAQAIPILEDAIAALNTLKPTDITLVKSMKNPPDAIKLVMAAVCVMKNVKADRIIDSSTGRMINDYWGPSKRVLGDMYFLQSLKEFDKDNIAPSIMKKIRTEYLPNKDFKPSVVAKASSAAEGLCKWVIAMDMYDKVAKEVSPKKAKLEIAEAEYNATMALLEEKRNQLRTLEEQLADLHHKLNEANQRKQALEDDVTLCANKLKRAEKLIGGLGGEKARWSAAADALQKDYDSLAGDILICCGVICYLSPFTSSYRNKCIDDWRAYVSDLNIPCSEEFSFRKVLGSDIKIQAWNIAGLPNDSFSVENAIIVDTSRRYSLLIDPQGQANRWIKALEKLSGLKTVKCMNNGFTKTLHNCIEFGYPLLLENVGEVLEASLEPILMKQIFQQGETLCVKIGDTVLEYNPTFRLYLTSKLINPHFMPHVFNRVTIVNFALTLEGLEDQLLGIVVAKERPYLEETRRNLIVQSAANETALKDVEDGILITLSETKGNILEDESAINVLDSSKALAQGIKKREAKAQESASMIENFRFSFRQIARHSAILYYCLTDLPNIDPMYQYSLEWFINLYSSSIERSNKARDVNKRMEYIADAFTYNLYTNVSLSLFEKDKLLFSFVLCTNIMMAKEKLSKDEFKFFVTGVPASEKILENPEPSWLPNKCWNEICHLDIFPKFEGFLDSFVSSVENWKIYYDNVDSLEVNMPEPWNEKLSNFQKLIIIKIFHPDKILHAIQNFVQNEMGGKYVAPPAFDIAKSFEYSNCLCPLIFVLSPGADPMTSLVTFSRKMGKNLHSVSLGQGQGPLAQKIIKKGQEGGHWVCLQNCHLAVSWMPVLEKLWEEMNINNTSLNFRLWLTSYPSDKFPTGILQAGVKMTTEPPTGLQQSLLRSFMSEPIKESDFFSGCPGKEKEFSKLLYSLCFFHAVIQERKKFGSIGWNIPYGFDESDFQISLQQLQIFINEHDAIPFEIIVYLIGECNYGGRVSDDWDRRTLKTVLADFISEEVVTDEDYNFTNVGSEYGLPYHCEYRHFLHHIKGIPLVPSPEVFGLHTNAGITKDLRYGKEFFDAVLEVYGWIAVGRKEEDIMETNDILLQNIADILNKIPPVFDLDLAKAAYPARYEESLNVVLVKELEHLNVLLNTISTSLITLQKALKGFVMMSSELEAISSSLLMGKVPHSWKKASLPSSKPLGSYINDVLLCHENFHKWFAHGLPSCFWLPGFFFTHSFLTAVQLNFARKFKVPIEKLSFDFFILSFDITPNQPEEGCYIIGLFLDGAHWNRDSHTIQESKPRILQEMMPPIHMIPKCKESVEIGDRYVCPVYKTQDRRGATSTLGHSNNYIFPILLNTSHPVSHWIKRGVALICQLED